MATARRSTKRDQYTVVLEDIRTQFRVFGERLDGIDAKVDDGFARVDRRFDGVDRRLDGIDARLERLGATVHDHGHRLARIETALEKKVDRAEVETLIARPGSR